MKIESKTDNSLTLTLYNQTHTLANSLRYFIAKDPRVDFCGYSIPHPSISELNLRIQSPGIFSNNKECENVLETALDNLIKVSSYILEQLDQ
jgi:DNA-directed RNA polymerase I and III subunit RPAC2